MNDSYRCVFVFHGYVFGIYDYVHDSIGYFHVGNGFMYHIDIMNVNIISSADITYSDVYVSNVNAICSIKVINVYDLKRLWYYYYFLFVCC